MLDGPLRLLLLEDDDGDFDLFSDFLSGADLTCRLTRAIRVSEVLNCLRTYEFDIIVLDLNVPDSNGIDTFNKVYFAAPTLPIVMLTGFDDRATALEALQSGAQDYLIKHDLSSTLLERTLAYAIERKAAERERQRLFSELQVAHERISTLRGLLPICSSCKKIRDDNGYWNDVEQYISSLPDAEVTHGLCPGCFDQQMQSLDETPS